MASVKNGEILVFVGTYTRMNTSEGIYVYRLDPANGALEHLSTMPGQIEPSFLVLDPTERFLYAVNEHRETDGTLSAFSVDAKAGTLTFLNQESTRGTGPCYLCVDKTNKYILVSNYNGGSVAVLPILPDGSVGPTSDFIQHHGSSVMSPRQDVPHAHSINLDPSNRYAFVPDLGMDKIMIYSFDAVNGKLTPNEAQPWVTAQPASGPRHFAFHPSGKYACLLTEVGSTVTTYSYDASRGALEAIETLSTLPEGYSERNGTAEVIFDASGRHIYCSNRGHGSIAMFDFDDQTGGITALGQESTQGRMPRNFRIDPTGTLLLAANMDNNTIVPFHIDQETGRLTPTGAITLAPAPVCIKMIRVGA